MTYFLTLFASFIAVIAVISIHEFAHAFVAYKCGDPTAKFEGRMTLNPTKHMDPLGIFMFAFIGFGWAKPVPVNPYNFKNYRWGSFWTSSAGIIANYLMAFLIYPLWLVVFYCLVPLFAEKYAAVFLTYIFKYLYLYSLSFCVFNLLPFYPLDGFRMVEALNTRGRKVYEFLRQYGYYILLGLLLINMLAQRIPYLYYIDVLGYFTWFATNILGKPITLLWNWVFRFIIV